MKKLICFLICALLVCSAASPIWAEDAQVTYDGNAQQFIFEPGTDYSPTDLFPNLKDVMPGDTRTQQITVKNAASNQVKVNIYLKALTTQSIGSELLEQLQLTVSKADSPGSYMFDATADQTAQLSDWVLLGTLYSGGEVDLTVMLHVPVTLGNEYQDSMGRIFWAFKVEEFPIEDSDPEGPQTGHQPHLTLWLAGLALSAGSLVTVILLYRKERKITS